MKNCLLFFNLCPRGFPKSLCCFGKTNFKNSLPGQATHRLQTGASGEPFYFNAAPFLLNIALLKYSTPLRMY
jgi:hypothetical protein